MSWNWGSVFVLGLLLSLTTKAEVNCSALLATGPAPLTTARETLPLFASSRETMVKYWKDVGLTSDLLSHYVNNPLCYSNGNAFVHCMAAINAIVSHGGRNLQIIPAAVHFETPQNIKVARDLGDAVFAVWIPLAKEPKAILAERHAFEAATVKAWMKLVNSGRRVDMEKLLEPMAKAISGQAEESYIVANAINEFMQISDAHARIVPVEMLKKDHDSDVIDQLVGIGVNVIEKDGLITIDGLIDGGPAMLSGLRAGDKIIAADGKVLTGDLRKGAAALSGLENTQVILTIKRGEEALEFRLVRKPVEIKNVAAKFVELGATKLGVVSLSSFIPENSAEQIEMAVKAMEAKGAQTIVLDLRGNPGGSLHIAVKIAALFLGADQKVVTSKSLYPTAIADKTYMTAKDAKAITALPLVVLINPMSASASELLSGALQDHKRAWVVGERSYGKGTVQAGLKPMGIHKALQDKEIVVFQTIARFYLPSGRTNQLVGVTPDFLATRRPGEALNYPREEDNYPNALKSVGEAAHSERSEDTTKQLRACIDTTGGATTRFNAPNSTLPQDYQLHVVLDLMACFERLKIQPMAMLMQ